MSKSGFHTLARQDWQKSQDAATIPFNQYKEKPVSRKKAIKAECERKRIARNKLEDKLMAISLGIEVGDFV